MHYFYEIFLVGHVFFLKIQGESSQNIAGLADVKKYSVEMGDTGGLAEEDPLKTNLTSYNANAMTSTLASFAQIVSEIIALVTNLKHTK